MPALDESQGFGARRIPRFFFPILAQIELRLIAYTGSSSMALDVLSSIASEYLMNVGRTLRFYVDKYSNNMTSEVGFRLD